MTLHNPWHLWGKLFLLIIGVCSGSPPQPPPPSSASCPSGLPHTPALAQRGSLCYLFVNNQRTWNDARSDCHSKGGYLAEVPDQATQDFLVGAIHSQGWNRNGVWIGATDNDQEGTWIWDTGRPMTFRNWAPGQEGGHSGWLFGPNHELPPNEMEDCALLRLSDGNRWHDFPCDLNLFSYAYVCQFDAVSTATSTSNLHTRPPPTTSTMMSSLSSGSNTCPQNVASNYPAKQRGQWCYMFFDTLRTWSDARGDCHGKGGYLVEVMNQDTQHFLVTSLRSLQWSGRSVWLGGKKNSISNGSWAWDTGNSFRYSNWARGQNAPASFFDPYRNLARCVQLRLGPMAHWFANPCDVMQYEASYVCQFGVSRRPTTRPATARPTTTRRPATASTTRAAATTATTKSTATTSRSPTTSNTLNMTCPRYLSDVFPARQFGPVCYLFVHRLRTWKLARDACHSMGGNLVEVPDNKTQQFLVNSLRSLNWDNTEVWIGGTDSNGWGAWLWDSGRTLGYTHWAPGQSSHDSRVGPQAANDKCVTLRLSDSGRWHSYRCDYVLAQYYSVCQIGTPLSSPTTTRLTTARPTTRRPSSTTRAAMTRTTTKPATTTTTRTRAPTTRSLTTVSAQNSTCPRYLSDVYPARQFGPVCYLFVQRLKTWKLARDSCHAMGGYLVEILNNNTQQFLVSSLRSLNWNPSEAWIGGTDSNGRGAWLWDSGRTLGYTHWAPGQSSHDSRVGPQAANDKCVTLRLSDSGRWHSYRCDYVLAQYYSVCQIGLLPTTATPTTTKSTRSTTKTTTARRTSVAPTTTTRRTTMTRNTTMTRRTATTTTTTTRRASTTRRPTTTARRTTVAPTTTNRTTTTTRNTTMTRRTTPRPNLTTTTTTRRTSTTRRPTTTTKTTTTASRRTSPSTAATTTRGRTRPRPVSTTRATTTRAMTTIRRTTTKTTTAVAPTSRTRVPTWTTPRRPSNASTTAAAAQTTRLVGGHSSPQRSRSSSTTRPVGVTTTTTRTTAPPVNVNVTKTAGGGGGGGGSTPPGPHRPPSAGPPKPQGTTTAVGGRVAAGGATQRYRNDPDNKDKEIDQGAVAGIIVGSIAGIVVIGLIIALVYRSRHRWPRHLYSDQDVAFENFGYGTTVHFKPDQDNAVQLCDGSKDLPESQS